MLGRNFQRILAWFTIPAVLWVAGSLFQSEARYVLWTIALVLEYMWPVAGFWTPGLERSTTADWTSPAARGPPAGRSPSLRTQAGWPAPPTLTSTCP
jgi:hypothetical protein